VLGYNLLSGYNPLFGKTRIEKVESIAWLTAMSLWLVAVIGMSTFADPRGSFVLVGLFGSVLFCWAVFHARYRIGKEKRAQGIAVGKIDDTK
jgi:hypothetical protein